MLAPCQGDRARAEGEVDMDEIDVEPTSDPDRSLPFRTLGAALLCGAAGFGIGNAVVRILAGIAVPSYAKYIRSVRLDESLTAMPWWSNLGSERTAVWISWGLVGVAALFFPFFFNRKWWSRRIFSVAGVGKLLLTFGLLGAVDLLIMALTNATGTAPAGAGLGLAAVSHVPAAPWLTKVALAGVGTAALFIVAGERTLGGSLDRWRNPELTLGGVVAGSLVGFLIGASLALVAVWLEHVLTLLMGGMFGFLGESPEPSALGWNRLHIGLTAALGLLCAAAGALPVALGPSASSGGRRLGALFLALLPVGAIFAGGTWFQGYCLDRGEMRHPSLASVAGLQPAPPPGLLALPTPQGPRAFAYPFEVDAMGTLQDEKVGASAANLAKVRGYLEERVGRWTAHSQKAYFAVPAIRDRLLQPEEAVRAQIEVAESPGLLVTTQLLAMRLQYMPATPAAREAGERLLDPAKFKASGQGKARLAAVALNLGKLDRAKRLWQESLAEGYKPEAGVTEPTVVPPADGAISGIVRVGDQPAAGVRVALYRVVTPFKLEAVPHPLRLLAAATTDADGSFSFTGLAPRAYHLGALLPEALGGRPDGVTVEGNLGPFDLAAGERKVDAGTITVRRK